MVNVVIVVGLFARIRHARLMSIRFFVIICQHLVDEYVLCGRNAHMLHACSVMRVPELVHVVLSISWVCFRPSSKVAYVLAHPLDGSLIS